MKLEEIQVGDIVRTIKTDANPNPPDLEVVSLLPQEGKIEVRPVRGNLSSTVQIPASQLDLVTKDGAKSLPPESERRDNGVPSIRDTRDATAKAGDLPLASEAAPDGTKFQARRSRHA